MKRAPRAACVCTQLPRVGDDHHVRPRKHFSVTESFCQSKPMLRLLFCWVLPSSRESCVVRASPSFDLREKITSNAML